MSARASLIFLIVCNVILVLTSVSIQAQAQQKTTLKDIKIEGNMRVEDDGIRLHLKSRTGDSFDPATVDQDVKAIYRMGFFDDVKADLTPDGVLIYTV
ncbi:MAG TPA: POTRA domain-containing protein, partial [Candidatus Binatia bacterium]|nr:POTRA domain-containing protein [Candidatus Binatia bacterium]